MGIKVGQFAFRPLGCLGDYPADYVFRGAVIYYSANINAQATAQAVGHRLTAADVESLKHAMGWDANAAQLIVQSVVVSSNPDDSAMAPAGTVLPQNLTMTVLAQGDLSSLNDVKSILDGIATGARFRLLGSMVRFISNPRTDDKPQQGTIPPEAGNTDTPSANPPSVFDIGSALDWWSQGIESVGASVGLPSVAATLGVSTSVIGIAAALALLYFIKR